MGRTAATLFGRFRPSPGAAGSPVWVGCRASPPRAEGPTCQDRGRKVPHSVDQLWRPTGRAALDCGWTHWPRPFLSV